MKKIVYLFLEIILCVGMVACGDISKEKTEVTSENNRDDGIKSGYTIMVYMVGSTLEDYSKANASNDIQEMLDSGIDFEKNNVIVYTGGSTYWKINVSSNKNSTIQLKKDGQYEVVSETDIVENMGEADTLANFVNYCENNYSAEHYGLICWNHGGGPLNGFGNDEWFSYDGLTLDEMSEAMEKTSFRGDKKLDFIGFDACLMSSIEVADIWSNYARYLLASEESEPGDGWDYSALSKFNDTTDMLEIGREIVDKYSAYYENGIYQYENVDTTLACIDLNAVKEFEEEFEQLFEKMNGEFDAKILNYLYSRIDTKDFTSVSDKGTLYLDLVDLLDMIEQLETVYPGQLESLKDKYNKMVPYKQCSNYRNNGLSIYYPCVSVNEYQKYKQLDNKSVKGLENYQNYISRFVSFETSSGKEIDWKLSKFKEKKDEYTLKLSKEQKENTLSIKYNTYLKLDNGGYNLLNTNCVASLDNNGVIHIPKKQSVIRMKSEFDEKGMVWPVEQVYSDGENTIWRTRNTRFGETADSFEKQNFADVSILFTENEKGEITINDIEQTGMNGTVNAVSGKETIDSNEWKLLYYYLGNALKPVYDENKNVKPYSEWKDTGDSYFYEGMAIEEGMEFTRDEICLDDNIYCQVIVTDFSGEQYGSELKQVGITAKYKEYTQKIKGGEIKYRIYSDHAEEISYKGTASKVEIPKRIKGKKVTVIHSISSTDDILDSDENLKKIILPSTVKKIYSHAFFNNGELKEVNIPKGVEVIAPYTFAECRKLKSVDLPDSVRKIGYGAFQDAGINYINIPKNVECITPGAFTGAWNLENITISLKNTNYAVENGDLYTSDFKKLVKCCSNNADKYVVRDGVEEICDEALYLIKEAEEIVFPDSLKKIGKRETISNTKLKRIDIPDSVEKIEQEAFLLDNGLVFLNAIPELQITIGKNVADIGLSAFSDRYISSFTVDKENQWFSTKEGSLTNKSGDVLIQSIMNVSGAYSLPDGITTVLKDSLYGIATQKTKNDDLDKYDAVTELVIPDSVLYFYDDIENLEKIHIGKGVKFLDVETLNEAENLEIEIDNENSYYKVENGKIVNK